MKNRYEKGERIQREDDLIFDEDPNAIICLDVFIQQENLQQKHVTEDYFRNKVMKEKNLIKYWMTFMPCSLLSS